MADRPLLRRAGGRARRAWRRWRGPSLTVVVAVDGASDVAVSETLASIARHVPGAGVVVEHDAEWLVAADRGVARVDTEAFLVVRGGDVVLPGVPDALLRLGSSGALWARPVRRSRPDPWLERADAQSPVSDLGPSALLLRGRPARPFAPGHPELNEGVLETLLAGDVVVHPRPLVERRPGLGRGAWAAAPDLLTDLDQRAAALRAVTGRVVGTPLARAWGRQLADVEVPRLLDRAEEADDAEWRVLREIVALVDPERAGALPRTLLHLAEAERRDDLVAVAEQAWRDGHHLRTEVVDGEVLARWPVDVPDDARRLHPRETPLRAAVTRRGADRATVHLHVPHVDLAVPDVVVKVRHVHVPAAADTVATRAAGHRFAEALAVTLPVTAAATRLPMSVEIGDLHREATVQVPALADEEHDSVPADPTRVVDVAVQGDDLVVSHRGDGSRLRLVADDGTPWPAPAIEEDLDVGLARWSLRLHRWGRDGWRTGPHRLLLGADPAPVEPGLLPVERLTRHHRLVVERGPHGGLLVRLAPPLGSDELGPRAQQRLQEHWQVHEGPLDRDAWFFETYAGRSATDSPLAIFEELRRRDPLLRAHWSIADADQWIPDGAAPVVRHSAAWYEAMATAGTLVLNTDTDEWFRRRPGQVLLQCFHGYPSKGMGRDQWAALGLPPREVRMLRHRGVDQWSAILTPTPEMTAVYREQYGYDGPAFEHGYPRDDDLVAPPPARLQQARLDLGIGSRRAVLHAPTWREHLSTRPRGAEMTDHLDAALLADLLGPDWVVLERGHRFHRPVVTHPRVVDVTEHPEVNDLMLASDAAVLDYSSLRFDYALLGRPMVFLVPDLADYRTGSRAFLAPYEETAPGPLVATTEEVAAALADPDLLEQQWRASREAFVAAHQPWQDGRAAARVVDGLLAVRETATT